MKVKIQMIIEPSELTKEEIEGMTDKNVILNQYGSSAKGSIKKNKKGNYVVTIQYDSRSE